MTRQVFPEEIRTLFYGVSSTFRKIRSQIDGELFFLDAEESTYDLLASCEEYTPQVILLETTSSPTPILNTVAHLQENYPAAKIIVLAYELDDAQFARQMMSAGAMGFLLQSDDIPSAIRVVRAGKLVLSPEVTQLLLQK